MTLSKKIKVDSNGQKLLTQQFRRYKSTVFWLFREFFRRYPTTVALALTGNFVGPMLMGSALAGMIHLVGRMEKNRPLVIDWLNLTLDLRQPQNFALMIGVAGLMMLISAIIIFFSNRIIIYLANMFAIEQSRVTLTLGGGRPARNADPEEGPYPRDVSRCARSIVGTARAVRPLLQVFQPFSLFLFSLFALFYINAGLTGVVFLVVLSSLVFQYQINLTAAKNEESLGVASRKMQKEIKTLLDDLAMAPRISDSMAKALKKSYDRDAIREFPARYKTRILARPKSQLVSNILVALLAVIIVSFLGIKALNGHMGWSLMLGYIIFARTAMVAMRNLMGTITGFARHYPRSRKANTLLTSWPGPQSFDADMFTVPRNDKESPGDLKSVKFHRGEVLGVLSPVLFTRYNTYAWADVLSPRRRANRENLWGAMVCVPDAIRSCPGASLRELLGLPATVDASAILQAAMDLGNDADLSGVSPDTPLDAGAWKQLPRFFRSHLLLAQAAQTSGDVVLVEHKILKAAQAAYRKTWWEKMAGRYVIVRHQSPATLGAWDEKTVLAMRTDRKTALMSVDWAKEHADTLDQWFAATAPTEGEADDAGMSDEDD